MGDTSDLVARPQEGNPTTNALADEVAEVANAIRESGNAYYHNDCGLSGTSDKWEVGQKLHCANCYYHELAARLNKALKIADTYQRNVLEPNEKVYGKDVEAARNVLKKYRVGKWHINGQIVREALDAAAAALRMAATMDRAALIAKARKFVDDYAPEQGEPEFEERGVFAALASALEADAKKEVADAQREAALKALCDEPQHLGQPRRVVSPSKIRALYPHWAEKEKTG